MQQKETSQQNERDQKVHGESGKQDIARKNSQNPDRLVQQNEPLKNNDHDINGDAEQSKSHRNGGQA